MIRCEIARFGVWVLALLYGCGRLEPPPAPDGERAFRDLVTQVEFGPRLPGSEAAEACRRFIEQNLADAGAQTGRQDFRVEDPYGGGTLEFANVVAHFFPERPYRVLLGAHFDSRPWADQDSLHANEPVPGANDGASGVAVLLELGRILADWDPGIGVDMAFFDGEDYGKEGDVEYYLLGSKYFVQSMQQYRPRAMLLVDLVGDKDLNIPMESYSLQMAPRLTRLVFAIADSLQAPGFDATEGRAVMDDHLPFLQRGIPSVDLIDLDYDAWHTVRDLPDQCSPASLESVTRVLLHVLHRLGRDAGA